MKITKIVLIWYFAVILCACNKLFSQELTKAHTTQTFSIQFPDNWVLDTSGQMNTQFLLYSPLLDYDDFSENVNLLIQDLSEFDIDMQQFIEISKNQIKAVPNNQIVESKAIVNSSPPYYRIVWSGKVAGRNLKFKQHLYIINKKAYILTFTAAINEYENYIKTGTTILDSFKFN